jgi:putative flippase GtrA
MIGQFLKYILTAACSAVTDWLAFLGFLFIPINPVAAQMASRLLGGLLSFVLNRHWSFRDQKGGKLAMHGRRFILTYCLSYAISVSIMVLGVEVLRCSPYWTKLAADSTCLLFNFVLMRTYVFVSRAGVSNFLRGLLGHPAKQRYTNRASVDSTQ